MPETTRSPNPSLQRMPPRVAVSDIPQFAWRAAPLSFIADRMGTAISSAGRLPVADVLRIAQEDAQAVYRDLSGFKITLVRCPDGWHVDYDLTDPLSAGGGPMSSIPIPGTF